IMKYSKNSLLEIKNKLNRIIFKQLLNALPANFSYQDFDCNFQKTRDIKFGDYSSNILMKSQLSKEVMDAVSKNIIKALPKKIVQKAEVVGPGFLNI
ncbi:MAG: hypothetical protein K2M43_02970, partial [Mycoplasmoidaceae bacterium]|nr:hypothetical protein [Mycoplasmoidaceae bacterium]